MRPAHKMEEGARKGFDVAEDRDICMRISVQRFFEGSDEHQWKRRVQNPIYAKLRAPNAMVDLQSSISRQLGNPRDPGGG